MYDLRRAAMAIWVDGCFATLFFKQRECTYDFYWFVRLIRLVFKTWEKSGERRGEPSVQF